jgi:hypothetical protein
MSPMMPKIILEKIYEVMQWGFVSHLPTFWCSTLLSPESTTNKKFHPQVN